MKRAHQLVESDPRAQRPVARRVRRLAEGLLRRFGLGVRPLAELETLDRALHWSYYWYNAGKKPDLRQRDGFGKIAETTIAQKRTYLNFDRLYTLWQALSGLTSDDPALAEVGAYRGGSARFMAETLRHHGRSNRLYVFDTFEGHAVVDPTVDGKHQVGKQFQATSLEKVQRYLRHYDNVEITQGDFCQTATSLDDVGDFWAVHVDVDVYPVTLFALNYFADRIVPGGMIVVDDYGFKRTRGAEKAVEEFVELRDDYVRLHLLTGQAVLIKLGATASGSA